MNENNLTEIIDLILQGIEKLPFNIGADAKKKFLEIKELILEGRPPRIIVIGRRGSGKSSVINAIFNERVAEIGPVISETGEGKWHKFENNKGTIEILDTRGFGDATKPGSSHHDHAIDDIKQELNKQCPDAILFLSKAKEVDAQIDKDISLVADIKKYVKEKFDYPLPLITVVTQVDELDPLSIVKPPYDNKQKQGNIDLACIALRQVLENSKIEVIKVIPVSAYSEYDENKKATYSRHYNIDKLVDYLMENLPKTAQLQLARLAAIKEAQRKLSKSLVKTATAICAGLAATPIPVADIIPITSTQIMMITGIAYISGRELSKESAKEFLAALGLNVGVAFAIREVVRGLGKWLFPIGGELISAAVAGAATWGIGEAAIVYFIEEASIDAAKQRFEKAKNEYKPLNHNSRDA